MLVNKKIRILLVLAVALMGSSISEASISLFQKPSYYYPVPLNPTLPASPCKMKPVVVAIIDTGFGYEGRGLGAHLCKLGHKDFTGDQNYETSFGTQSPVPKDSHGHGTNIAGIIDREAGLGDTPYCLVILKYWRKADTGYANLLHSIMAINYAREIHADYINYSAGGIEENATETGAVKAFLDGGGKFIAAAGNESQNLGENKYFPAMSDPRIIVVGNKTKYGKVSSTSNYGSLISRWEVGEDISVYDISFTGTSQSTAVATGKIIAETEHQCKLVNRR